MSVPMLHADASPAGPSTLRGLRLRLKPGHRPGGLVQGAWWPRSTQLATELWDLLDVLASRSGPIDRVIYDENLWASTPLRIEVRGHSVILEASRDQSINTLTVIGQQFGKLVLLVVPPYTKPARAYTAVMTASKPEDCSSADELLGISAREADDRRLALLAQQRWESERRRTTPRTRPRPTGVGRAGTAGAPCSVTVNSTPCATSSAGFDGKARN